MQFICFNGAFLPVGKPLFTAANRCFKWGDGVFETAKFCNGRLLLSAFHFERLFSSLQVLQIASGFTAEQLTTAITALCEKNQCRALARVRIAVCREENNQASYVIEATGLTPEKMQWNEKGWRITIYPFARKSCDAFSNLKCASYLPYVMAARYATEKEVDESLVLNGYGHICDGSKTNLFLLNGIDVETPALSEGCIAGVMRRYVLEVLKSSGYAVHQKRITETDVLNAEQVFVTNAIEGLRWVRHFGERKYEHGILKKLYYDLFSGTYTKNN